MTWLKLVLITFVISVSHIPDPNRTAPNAYKLSFNTAYSQFYIGDKGCKGNTGGSDFWNDKAHHERLASDIDILGVGIESYGRVNAEFKILDKSANIKDIERYDHVVEGSLTIRSGVLEVTDCPNNRVQLQVKLNPGDYRVRVYSIDLSKADRDLYTGKDSYKVEIWPAKIADRKVLKQYH
ncbi:hypothetical protein [Mucilaginibacter myungsuensis]|uniref:Uncharacterized protein n=1 Tax=Mucilaginibacter myungsuensis TaxID=649104 RepID=A0A929KX39_9SPHI|nr:hypothetical protein [Mucilaginibacter myungsuensis]MBE9662787.1 hypothetical protein [Mucilaginibacter myungsuensis]MDN3598207.1 hypothetical protein [Mucilaginibacter myungsuensis]